MEPSRSVSRAPQNDVAGSGMAIDLKSSHLPESAVRAAQVYIGAPRPVPISAEVHLGEPQSEVSDAGKIVISTFNAGSRLGRDLTMLEKATVEKVTAKFIELKEIFISNIRGQAGHLDILQGRDIHEIKVVFDTGAQTAKFWVGDGEVTTVSLANKDEYYSGLNELKNLVSGEIHGETRDIERFQSGVLGFASQGSLFANLSKKDKEKRATLKSFFKDVFNKHFKNFVGGIDPMRKVMKVEAYREGLEKTLKSEIIRLQKSVKSSNNPEENNALSQVKDRLMMLQNAYMYAVYAFIADPKIADNKELPEMKQLKEAVGAFALPVGDQGVYQEYCLKNNLDYTKSIGMEQFLIAAAQGRSDVKLFDDIKNADFQKALAACLKEVKEGPSTQNVTSSSYVDSNRSTEVLSKPPLPLTLEEQTEDMLPGEPIE